MNHDLERRFLEEAKTEEERRLEAKATLAYLFNKHNEEGWSDYERYLWMGLVNQYPDLAREIEENPPYIVSLD